MWRGASSGVWREGWNCSKRAQVVRRVEEGLTGCTRSFHLSQRERSSVAFEEGQWSPTSMTRRDALRFATNSVPEKTRVATDLQSRLRNASMYRDQFYVTYHDLEEALRRKGYSLYRLGAITLLGLGGLAAVYWGNIKRWGAQEGAEVASQTLGDERFLNKAEDLAKSIANALLTDVETSVAAQEFLKGIAVHENSLDEAKTFMLEICSSLLDDKELMAKTSRFMGKVVRSEPVWESAKNLGSFIIAHPDFQEQGLKTIRDVFQSPDFKSHGYEYLADSFDRTLKSEQVRQKALHVSTSVINEPSLREAAGEALWAATKSGILGMKVKSDLPKEGKQRLSANAPAT